MGLRIEQTGQPLAPEPAPSIVEEDVPGNPFSESKKTLDNGVKKESPFQAPPIAESVQSSNSDAPGNPFASPPPPGLSRQAKSEIKRHFDDNVPRNADGTPKEATTFLEGIEAGIQKSAEGLFLRGRKPDILLPEDAPMYMRIAEQVGQVEGDLPAMVFAMPEGAATGAAIGGMIGGPFGAVAGAIVGGGAASFAFPEALRRVMMDSYENGEVKDFADFWARASSVLIGTGKAAVIGGATAGVGAAVGKVLSPVIDATTGQLISAGVSPLTRGTATIASEIATMTIVGSALEGRLPEPQEFLDAAMLVGGFHAAGKIATKLRKTYAETGATPQQVLDDANTSPDIKMDLLSENDEIPKAYGNSSSTTQLELGSKNKTKSQTEKTVRSDAENKILSQIQTTPEAEKVPLKERVKEGAYQAYSHFVEKLFEIKRGVDQLANNPDAISAEENPYILSRMANDYRAKTLHVLENGTLDFKTLAKNGESLSEVLKPVRDDLDGLNAFMAAFRSFELERRGIESGFDSESAKQVLKDGASKYGKVAKALVDFQNRNLQYLRDSGVISSKAFDLMLEANRAYIPFKRIFTPEEIANGKGSEKGSSLKSIQGSERAIQSPLQSIVENTESMFRMAENNRAVGALVKLAENSENKDLIKKVKTPMKNIGISPEEIARFFREHGVAADASAFEGMDFDIFRPKNSPLKDNQFAYLRDGKKEIYETKLGLAKAIKAIDGDITSTNILVRFARGVTAIKKVGITYALEFATNNMLRDQTTASVFTKGGTKPFVDVFAAIGNLIEKDDIYYNWLKAGGAGGTFINLNKSTLQKDIFALDKETGFIENGLNVLKTAHDKIEGAFRIIEQAPRLAEFKRVSQGETSGPKIFEGGFASREVTVDFERIGSQMSAYNSVTAFLNPAIQGVDKTVRAIRENPKEVISAALALITLPSVLLWVQNHNDPRYTEIPQWEKDLYWHFLLNNWQKAKDPTELNGLPAHLVRQASDGSYEVNHGTILKYRKPQELGLFGSLAERTLDAFFTDNPDAYKNFAATIQGLIVPNLTPDTVLPVVEQGVNKSLFLQAPLVPDGLKGLLPDQQYTNYTSESAKILGKFISVLPGIRSIGPRDTPLSSPIVLENYIRSWSGSLGNYALQVADQLLIKSGTIKDPIKPDYSISDIPFIKAFVTRYPSAQSGSITSFEDSYIEAKASWDSFNHAKAVGRTDDLQKILDEHQANIEAFKVMEPIQKALATHRKMINFIYNNADMTREEKKQQIDGLYYGMIEMAKEGNAALDIQKRNAAKTK